MRDKTDVRDSVLGLTFINQLRPVDYKWNYRDAYVEQVTKTVMIDEISIDPDTGEKIIIKVPVNTIERVSVLNDGSKARNRYHHGLIAQEVKTVMDNTSTDFGGYQDHKLEGGVDVLSIGYSELIAPLIKSVQELSAQVVALQLIIDGLTANAK